MATVVSLLYANDYQDTAQGKVRFPAGKKVPMP